MQIKTRNYAVVLITAVCHLTACITINRQTNITQINQEPTQESSMNAQTAVVHPSPTPADPFPGIIYQMESGIWQVQSYNENVRLTEAPTVNSPTNRQLRPFHVDQQHLQHAAISPNGNWLAVTYLEDDGQTSVWAIKRDNDEQILLGKGMNAVWSPDGRYLIYNTNGRPQLTLADQNFAQIHLNLPPGSQVIAWPLLN